MQKISKEFHNICCRHVLCQGIFVPSYVMACELFATKYRTFAGTISGNFWATAICLYALLAYLLNNWVHFQLIISLLSLLTIPLYWYILRASMQIHFCKYYYFYLR